jgi:hypothetical protein
MPKHSRRIRKRASKFTDDGGRRTAWLRYNGSWRSPAMLEGTDTLTVNGFDHITFNPRVMGGRACIRGMRLRLRWSSTSSSPTG